MEIDQHHDQRADLKSQTTHIIHGIGSAIDMRKLSPTCQLSRM